MKKKIVKKSKKKSWFKKLFEKPKPKKKVKRLRKKTLTKKEIKKIEAQPVNITPKDVINSLEPKEKLIRLKGSDKVYVIKKVRRWVKNPETLDALGAKMGEEKYVDADYFNQFEEGEPLDLATSDTTAKEPIKEIWQ